jgi:hypothetical protein
MSDNTKRRTWIAAGKLRIVLTRVELTGVSARHAAVADDRVVVHLHRPRGGADAVPLGKVLEDRQRLVLGQLGPELGRHLPLREPRLGRAAVEHPALLVLAGAGADRQVPSPRLPWSGQSWSWQQERDRSSCMATPP